MLDKVFSKFKNHKEKNSQENQSPMSTTSRSPLIIQTYCHNIRLETPNLMKGEKPWNQRKHGVCSSIIENSKDFPTIVGLQEVKHNQLEDIMSKLGSEWTYFGKGRDDGKTKGEYAPILYKKNDWTFLSGQVHWLSDTPSKPSKGWDAALPRIVTTVVLKHVTSGKVINLLNTHYDHKGKNARIQSSKFIMELMSKTVGDSILCGDFNSQKHEEAYKTLNSGGLKESSTCCDEKGGFEYTNTGFELGKEENSIDFIWTSKTISILRHQVLTSEYNGIVFSDHRPVVALIGV